MPERSRSNEALPYKADQRQGASLARNPLAVLPDLWIDVARRKKVGVVPGLWKCNL